MLLVRPSQLQSPSSGTSTGYCNSTCQEDAEKFYIQSIQAKLLQELHLRGPLHHVKVPRLSEGTIAELLEDRNTQTDEANRVMILSETCSNDLPDCVSFDLAQTTLATAVSAQLRFYVDLSIVGAFESSELEFPDAVPVTVRIFRVFEDGTVESRPIVQRVVGMEASQRVEMNIDLNELKSWKEQSIVGLTIRAEYEAGRDLLVDGVIKPSAKVNQDVIPSLILETEKPKKRNRRHGEMYCPAGSNEKGCCLRDMKIDFAKLGWKFILAPVQYNAYMCRGECGIPQHHLLRFGHSKIINDAKVDSNHHCCYPAEYESLKIIYTRADNEVVITRVPGMIAKRCACT